MYEWNFHLTCSKFRQFDLIHVDKYPTLDKKLFTLKFWNTDFSQRI